MRHRAVAHPLDQRLLDLHDDGALDPRVGEHALEGEAEPQPADQDRGRDIDEVEGLGGELDLAGRLEGVHHEDPVHAQLEDVGGGVRRTPAQHDVASLGLGPGDLDALHGHHPDWWTCRRPTPPGVRTLSASAQSKISLSQLSFFFLR